MDFLHVGWRLRLPFIHAEKYLQIGPFRMNWRVLLKKEFGGHPVRLLLLQAVAAGSCRGSACLRLLLRMWCAHPIATCTRRSAPYC